MNWSGTILKKCLCIIIVSLNPGDRLKKTLDSVFSQTAEIFDVVIKDGGSTDESLDRLEKEGYFEGRDNVTIIRKNDKSIYDGMNQAVEYVLENADQDIAKTYCMFLNCGDTFHDENVLKTVESYLKAYDIPHIIYGDQYNLIQKSTVSSAPGINEFTLFRNVPCHQVCFYSLSLFEDRAYDVKYTVRADYEHFLYSWYEKKAVCDHINVIISDYEGGGYSETVENRKRSASQHREITDRYMGARAAKYRLIMLLTLAPLRTKMAESPVMSRVYNSIKSAVYRRS